MTKARDLANASTALSVVSATELAFLDGVTSAVQTQINTKQAVVSGVDDTELGYLNGVTSALQTQLNQKPEVVAGKNKIINGDFFVNQRAFTSTTTSNTYGFDRWFIGFSGGTVTYSAQTFTLGTAPVAGYEGTNFARVVTASQSAAGNFTYLQQRMENVRTFANQTVTVSFWAKASTGTPSVGVVLEQQFGTGGSGTVVTSGGTTAITTSWARYSKTISVPSVAGKTIGTGTVALNLGLMTSVGTTISAAGYPAVGLQNETIDFWGVQVEAGNVATPFTTATGTVQGELAACQRYYYQSDTDVQTWTNLQYQANVNVSRGGTLYFPQTMRTTPTLTLFDSPGNSGKVSVSASSGGYSDNITPNMFGTGRNTYAFYVIGTYVLGYVSKFTASAEL